MRININIVGRAPFEDNMLWDRSDRKNIELLKMVARLRAHMDVDRIIGLNFDALRKTRISEAFLGYLQSVALNSAVIDICKMFEASSRNDLNSIPGIIGALEPGELSQKQREDFAAFGRKYGNTLAPVEAKLYLERTFGLFCGYHSASLDRLKKFRDRSIAHSDSRGADGELPSYAEFEGFLNFAEDFYRLVSDAVHDVVPATLRGEVAGALLDLMAQMGVKAPVVDFEPDE
jgi:hypothetical protein